jgi:hypothetical protein
LPPERHADRIVAEMMRQITHQRARLWGAVEAAIESSSINMPAT